jgi:predicted pyridoxine 5'-phosphate oxidase superfamily flavin-nucleotide-binding protein
MPGAFLALTATPAVRAAQAADGSRRAYERFDNALDYAGINESEAGFIAARDSFYLATVSETGWPYVQHRGGPAGFIKMLDPMTLAFADFRGNRQFLTIGNSTTNDRVALIMVDYPAKTRLKLLARIEIRPLADDPALAQALALPGYSALPERAVVLHLAAHDWNCPQHITPRWAAAEIAAEIATATASLNARIAALEAEISALRSAEGQSK